MKVMVSTLLGSLIGGSTKLCLGFLIRIDQDHGLHIKGKINWFIWSYSFLAGFYIVLGMGHTSRLEKAGYAGLALYLLIGSVTDLQTRRMYDFLHLAGAVIGGMLLLIHPPEAGILAALIIFCLLQYTVFRKMYGGADVMTFMICAMFESIYGTGLMTYMLHMALSFFILCIVQLLKGNINRKGNLKKPVALLPYISLSVWLFL